MIAAHVGLQGWIGAVVACQVIGPKLSIASHGDGQTRVTIGIRILRIVERALGDGKTIGAVEGIDEILCRAVSALAAGITHGEVVRLKGVGSSRTTSEENLLVALCIGDVADAPKRIERGSQALASSLSITDEVAIGLGSCSPKSSLFSLALAFGEEWRSLIKGSLCLESLDSELVGTTGLWLVECHITDVSIVGNDIVLDGVALRDNELENLIGRGAWQGSLLLTRHVVGLEGNATILAYECVIEIGACPSSLILIVVVEEHLLLVVLVQFELFELEVGPVVEHLIAIGNTFVGRCPHRLVRIGRTPVAIVEILDGIAIVAIDSLIGSRCKHGTRVVAPVCIDIIVNLGHEATDIGEGALHVLLVVGGVLVVVHLIVTRSEDHRHQTSNG